MFTVNHNVVNKRFIMHSWAGADGVATAEEKQKEKEYNAKYYQEHKKTVGGIRNTTPVSQPTTPSPTPATPAQPAAAPNQPTTATTGSGKKKTSSGRSIGTKPKIDDDIVQASATHKRTEGDRDFDDSFKTEENRVVKDLDMFTHKTDDGNTVFVLGDNKWYLPKGIDLTDADKKLLSDLWNQPDKDLPDTKEHVMELFLQAKMQTARNGQKKKKSEKTEDGEKKTTSKKSSSKKTSTKKSKKKTDNTEEEPTVNTTETPTSSTTKKKTYEDYLPDAYEKQKIKHFDDSDPSDFIAHFGIPGQQRGVQNGPPYPLGSGDHSSREVLFAEKAGVKVGQSSGKGSIENIKKANAASSKSGRKKKTEEELRADAEKAMAKADPKKIIKNIDQLSTQELADASQRVNYKASIEKLIPEEAKKTKLQRDTEKAANSADANEILKYSTYMTPQQLTDAVSKMKTVNSLKASMKPKSTFEKIEDVADRAAKIKDIAEKGIGIWNTMAKVHNSIDEKEWPVINMGGEKKDDKSKDQKKNNNGSVTPKDMMEFARILNSDRQQSKANAAARAAAKADSNDEEEKPQKAKSPINNDSNDFTAKSWYNNNDAMDIKISDYKSYSPYYDKETSKDSKKNSNNDSDDFLSNNWYNNNDVMNIKISDYKSSNNSSSSYDPEFDKWFKPSEDVSSGRAFDRAVANGSDDDVLLTPRQLSRREANYSDDYIEFLERTPKSKK